MGPTLSTLEWMFTIIAFTEILCFLWFICTLIMEIRKFYNPNISIQASESSALVHRSNSIQRSNGGDQYKSQLLPQSLSIVGQDQDGSQSNISHTSYTSSSTFVIDNLKAQKKRGRDRFLRQCILNAKIYYLFQVIIASMITFLSTVMMFNKIWYKFFAENIWFINSNNFDYLNNIYKTLSILAVCYLWNLARKNDGVQNGLLQVLCKSKWYSFDRQYFVVMLGFLISYNLAYDIFVKKDKWNDKWTHIMANLFDDVFVCIVIPLALSIDFNLKKKYMNKNNNDQLWIFYAEMFVVNILFLNIIIVLKYNILVYLIESTTFHDGMSLFESTGWSIYGFCNNYLMTRLIKMFGCKILFHDRKVRAPKCEKIQ